jgi:hypothetical protein
MQKGHTTQQAGNTGMEEMQNQEAGLPGKKEAETTRAYTYSTAGTRHHTEARINM